MLIERLDMADMASVSNGNVKALKTATGMKNWVAFCKILVESIFVMLEEDPQDWFNGATKRAPKKGGKKRTLSSTRIPERILSLSPGIDESQKSKFESRKRNFKF